ncbi:MAG: type II secretion system F family protein [Actinomycetes bacterium]
MQQWLYFLDNMSSATKAGFSIKESLVQALNSTEVPLKNDLYSAIIEINRSNQVSKVIPILKKDVTDEIGRNVVKIIELVHFLGASDLSKILSILSNSSREFHDLITELKTKQTWVLNGAKIAIAAPWVVLLALWTQENVRNSYQTINGQIVLFLVALLGVAGFLVMQKIGNLEIRKS